LALVQELPIMDCLCLLCCLALLIEQKYAVLLVVSATEVIFRSLKSSIIY
jgi:hypothetical protein